MMRETASAKATAPTKQVIHEAPVKFRSGKHTAIVKEVFDIAPQFPPTYLIRFTFENESVFDFEPGQFISIFAEKDGKRISRPYSIASWPENKAYLELCIKVVEGGFMSNYRHLVERWEREHRNFHFYPTISRPETPNWKGRVGYVQKVLENDIKDHGNKQVFICGLHDMVEDVNNLCKRLGFAYVRFEKWD